MRRWLRSLQAQLFLWAVLPVAFVIIALAFTGVYAHQQEMQDFVAERNLALVRLTARVLEDGLAHGVIGAGGGRARQCPTGRAGPGHPTNGGSNV